MYSLLGQMTAESVKVYLKLRKISKILHFRFAQQFRGVKKDHFSTLTSLELQLYVCLASVLAHLRESCFGYLSIEEVGDSPGRCSHL